MLGEALGDLSIGDHIGGSLGFVWGFWFVCSKRPGK